MQNKLLIFLSMAMIVSSFAHACSRAFAIDLDFAESSADLEKAEIVRLTAWLDKWRAIFPRFERVVVDGIALESAQDAKALSRRRAEVATCRSSIARGRADPRKLASESAILSFQGRKLRRDRSGAFPRRSAQMWQADQVSGA